MINHERVTSVNLRVMDEVVQRGHLRYKGSGNFMVRLLSVGSYS